MVPSRYRQRYFHRRFARHTWLSISRNALCCAAKCLRHRFVEDPWT